MSVLLKRLEKLGLVTTYLRQQNIPTKKYQAPGQLSIATGQDKLDKSSTLIFNYEPFLSDSNHCRITLTLILTGKNVILKPNV